MFSIVYVFYPFIIAPLEYYDLSYQQITVQEVYYESKTCRTSKRIKVNNLTQTKKKSSPPQQIKINKPQKKERPSTKELC
jgi:hypothetical protein